MNKNIAFQYFCISFTLGIFFTLSLYHLFVYIGRKSDKSNLSYSLLSIINGLYIFTARILPYFVNNKNFLTTTKIITVVLVGFSFAYFAHTVFSLTKIKFYTSVHFIIFSIIGLIAIIFIHHGILIKIFFVNALLYPLIFFIIMNYIVIRTRQYKEKKKRYIMIGYYLMLVMAVLVNLYSAFLGENTPFFLAILPFLIMMLIFAFALTSSFNKEHRDLIDLTNTLEQKVLERTSELQQAKEAIEQKEKQKTEAFINISHEIKTPVTIISSYLDKHIKEHGAACGF